MLASNGILEQASEREGMEDLVATGSDWVEVCRLERITPGTGVAAMVGGEQIALVRTRDGEGVYALSNFDPFSRAFVIARGIVGDRDGVPKIASPIFKQTFDLRSGECLDDPRVRLPVYPTRVRDGRIEILLASEGSSS
jgi:nitrite reductase (NADH) small subunit